MTETEQEHAQAIDLTMARINKLEKKVDELGETLVFTMRMVSNYLDKLEEEHDGE